MSLRARITTPEEHGGRGEDGHLVAVLPGQAAGGDRPRRDVARWPRPSAGPGWNASSATSSAARARCCPPPSAPQLIRRVVDEALGLGILEPLLEDASITEIMVNGPDAIFVERGGRVEQLPAALRVRTTS